MRSFFKIFFATLLALIVLSILGIVVLMGIIGNAISSSDKVVISPNGVLVLETSQAFSEQKIVNPLNYFTRNGESETPGLFDVVRLVDNAAQDDKIKGIYLKVEGNANGFATNQEFRNALQRFKETGKFVYAYGENISQQGYFVASVANKVYLHPKGNIEFNGFYSQVTFLKGLLEKLDIQPQIFYDGRFKSATEPLRETEMTPANRIQTNAYLGELYANFLNEIGQSRKIDTATLHQYANEGAIQSPDDAARLKLVDGLRYDDQVMDEIRKRLGGTNTDKINFVTLANYTNANEHRFRDNSAKIALIYAQGSIVSGDSEKDDVISSDRYIKLIREARLDNDIKAIVFRVNSPGGSALASESIWRELTLAKKDKPVIVSMGDYAASGGYYISCMADSIFAEPNTLTGSIGVFAVLPNLGNFFKNKLGVTFDGVKTAQYADLGTASRPLNDAEKRFIQNGVDTIYSVFKNRVVTGRKLSGDVVDSIAQGRVWSGVQAKSLGLVDRIGGLQDAIACAAKMAHVGSVKVKEYPETEDGYSKVMKSLGGDVQSSVVKKELGEHYALYEQVKRIKEMNGQVQARIPFDIEIK